MKKYLLILYVLFGIYNAQATHIVGGEFQVKHIRGYNYELNLFLYFDVNNGNPQAQDNNITVTIYSKADNTWMTSYNLISKSEIVLDYIVPECALPSLSTKKIRYSTEEPIYLNPSIYKDPEGYYIVWERCCRNNIITNIVDPENAGMAFYMEFPPVVKGRNRFTNSSPVLPDAFAEYACIDNMFQYSFKATDRDNDSLVYTIVNPLQGTSNFSDPIPLAVPGPYDPVTWETGFSTTNMIPGAPKLQVNRFTGLMEVKPSDAGLYVFSVKVEEYRSGVKIGEIRREYQLKVIDCPVNIKPNIALINRDTLGNTFTYVENDTIYLRADEEYCYDLKLADPDINQTLTFSFEPLNFDKSSVALENTSTTITSTSDTLRAKLCWSKCIKDAPPYFKMNLIATDNGCSLPKSDTITAIFKIEQEVNNKPVIWIEPLVPYLVTPDSIIEIKAGQELKFNVFAYDMDSTGLELTANGKEFDMVAQGMSFSPVSGITLVSSPFSWITDCRFTQAGIFTVQFWAKDVTCLGNDSVLHEQKIRILDINDSVGVFLPPNVFTPNGDNINDYFEIPNLPLDKCGDQYEEIQIYNRWGNKVYEAKSRDFKWEAFEEADGVYFYHVKYTRSIYKGHISIIR